MKLVGYTEIAERVCKEMLSNSRKKFLPTTYTPFPGPLHNVFPGFSAYMVYFGRTNRGPYIRNAVYRVVQILPYDKQSEYITSE